MSRRPCKGLRYGKVIIATDADVDGLHIRNLLITCFLRFFPDIIIRGFVHILETPLISCARQEIDGLLLLGN